MYFIFFSIISSLLPVLPNHVNAEICAGTITNRQQIVEYLAGTYLYRRLFANPAYYGLEQLDNEELTAFLSTIVDNCLAELSTSFCVILDQVFIFINDFLEITLFIDKCNTTNISINID